MVEGSRVMNYTKYIFRDFNLVGFDCLGLCISTLSLHRVVFTEGDVMHCRERDQWDWVHFSGRWGFFFSMGDGHTLFYGGGQGPHI